MGEHGSSPSPTQHPVQHRPAMSECLVGKERGFRCLPVVPGSSYCDNHHPDRLERRRENNSRAARVSHSTVRLDPETESWADNIRWDDEASIHQFLRETAVLVAKKALTPAQGQVMARLAEERLKGFQKAPAAPQNLLVEVQRFDRPTGEPGS